MIGEIISLQYWCWNLFMGLRQPTFKIGLLWILMLMAMTPEDRIWNCTSPRRAKRIIEIISCIWVTNCGTVFPSLYKILQTLNHSSVIIKCRNCSLALDWFSNIALFFAICQVLFGEMNVPYFLSIQLLVVIKSWGFNLCIMSCLRHDLMWFVFNMDSLSHIYFLSLFAGWFYTFMSYVAWTMLYVELLWLCYVTVPANGVWMEWFSPDRHCGLNSKLWCLCDENRSLCMRHWHSISFLTNWVQTNMHS